MYIEYCGFLVDKLYVYTCVCKFTMLTLGFVYSS